ncbi:hypothetical protein MCHI_001173 [Candidatus Magnetoovum chiemensis]|nr:hypothetical protein MCHI_001173 [Candidatus Magnetoovum chiemensis]
MKITEPDVIKTGERELIDSIKDDLDLDAVKEIIIKKIESSSFDVNKGTFSFDVNNGEIVVYNGQIAFKINCRLTTDVVIVFDRKGNYIPDSETFFQKTDNKPEEQYIMDNLNDDNLNDNNLNDDNLNDDIFSQDEHSYFEEHEEIRDNIAIEKEDEDDDDDLLKEEYNEAEEIYRDTDIDNNKLGSKIDNFEPISDLNKLPTNDDIEDILKESRDFWVNQEK